MNSLRGKKMREQNLKIFVWNQIFHPFLLNWSFFIWAYCGDRNKGKSLIIRSASENNWAEHLKAERIDDFQLLLNKRRSTRIASQETIWLMKEKRERERQMDVPIWKERNSLKKLKRLKYIQKANTTFFYFCVQYEAKMCYLIAYNPTSFHVVDKQRNNILDMCEFACNFDLFDKYGMLSR